MESDLTPEQRRALREAASFDPAAPSPAALVASQLPPDAALPPDAQALRAAQRTPLELAMEIVNDESLDMRIRLDAAKAAMGYMHRAPAAKSEVSVSGEALQGMIWQSLIAPGRTMAELDEAEAAQQALIDRSLPKH